MANGMRERERERERESQGVSILLAYQDYDFQLTFAQSTGAVEYNDCFSAEE